MDKFSREKARRSDIVRARGAFPKGEEICSSDELARDRAKEENAEREQMADEYRDQTASRPRVTIPWSLIRLQQSKHGLAYGIMVPGGRYLTPAQYVARFKVIPVFEDGKPFPVLVCEPKRKRKG